jgi:hypothetical protein
MRLYIYATGRDEALLGAHDRDGNRTDKFRAVNTVVLPAGNLSELQSGLSRLVRERKTFRHVLWSTHGAPGSLEFGAEGLTSRVLREQFAGNGYERLFPESAKMYFAGCNVAADTECSGACPPGAAFNAGWTFLETVGRVFLHGGGYTVGWTSYGWGKGSRIERLLVTSHMVHFSGDVRHVLFLPGGVPFERLSYDGAPWSGDLMNKAQIAARLYSLVPPSV